METDVVATNSSRNAIANLTAVAYSAERYLSQERFSNWLTSVNCNGDVIKFKFKNRRSFNAAKKGWKWVNDGKRRIIIVLSSGTCNNVARQPYLAKHVRFRGLTVTVEAQASAWGDAVSRGKLRLNTLGLVQSNDTLQKRLAPVQKSIDVGSSFSGKNLFSKPINNTALTASIECSECGTRGKLNLNIDVDFKLGKPKWLGGTGLFQGSGSGQITSSGVGADAVLAVRCVSVSFYWSIAKANVIVAVQG